MKIIIYIHKADWLQNKVIIIGPHESRFGIRVGELSFLSSELNYPFPGNLKDGKLDLLYFVPEHHLKREIKGVRKYRTQKVGLKFISDVPLSAYFASWTAPDVLEPFFTVS